MEGVDQGVILGVEGVAQVVVGNQAKEARA
jgi:hypothetical protein